jgi:hypothetical protein
METHLIFTKTDKGREEVDKRTCQLPFKPRSALIMVDGAKSVREHTVKLKTMLAIDAEPILEELLKEGFIALANLPANAKVVQAAVIVPNPNSAVSNDTPSAQLQAFDLAVVRRKAVKLVETAFGPPSQSLLLAIERCETRDAFIVQAQRAKTLFEQTKGSAKADAFWKDLGI